MPDQRPHLPAVPEAPDPTDYTSSLSYLVKGDTYFASVPETCPASHLTCTVCGEKIAEAGYMPEYGVTQDILHSWIVKRVVRHQRDKHPEKLWVWTNAGWIQAGHLFSGMLPAVHD